VRRVVAGAATAVAVVAATAVGVAALTSLRETGDRIAPSGEDRGAPLLEATWAEIPAAPIGGRYGHAAVWSGNEMIVWGGLPSGRDDHGGLRSGAAFDPLASTWRKLSDGPLEFGAGRTAVWTGDEMLVWGGETGKDHRRPDNGAAYDPETNSWRELPRSPHWSLANHSAVWTGREMIVWGGVGMSRLGDAFDPTTGEWRTIALAPIQGRWHHSAVWTGEEMIVWGGRVGDDLATDAAAYDPDSDSWRELPPAPIFGRDIHAAVWTGEEMIVWGGWGANTRRGLSDGAAYSPATDTWRRLPRAPIEYAVSETVGTWTGRDLIVVGRDGALAAYSPEQNAWTTVPEPPSGAAEMPALVGADDALILWGGIDLRSSEGDSNEGALLRFGE
jgi:N-acetylneuraminic acid mutarotase